MSDPRVVDSSASRGPFLVAGMALGLSFLSAAASWSLRAHWLSWWTEKGIILPGLTELWVSPIWHLLGAMVLVSCAGLIAIRGFFAIGVGFWVGCYAIYAAFTALALYLPWVKITRTLGAGP